MHSILFTAILSLVSAAAYDFQSAQIEYDPPTLAISDLQTTNKFKYRLKTKPDKPVQMYFEAPSLTFSNCSVMIADTEWREMDVNGVIALGGKTGDTTIDIKSRLFYESQQRDLVYKAKRTIASGGTCHNIGDPHYKMLDGYTVTNMGNGVYHNFHHPQLTIQTTQGQCWGKATCNHAAAIRYGSSIMAIDLRGGNGMKMAQITPNVDGIKYDGPNNQNAVHTVKFPCGSVLTLTPNKNTKDFWLDLSFVLAAGYEGHGGLFNQQSIKNKLKLRDGTLVAQSEAERFFSSWKVADNENLLLGNYIKPDGGKRATYGQFCTAPTAVTSVVPTTTTAATSTTAVASSSSVISSSSSLITSTSVAPTLSSTSQTSSTSVLPTYVPPTHVTTFITSTFTSSTVAPTLSSSSVPASSSSLPASSSSSVPGSSSSIPGSSSSVPASSSSVPASSSSVPASSSSVPASSSSIPASSSVVPTSTSAVSTSSTTYDNAVTTTTVGTTTGMFYSHCSLLTLYIHLHHLGIPTTSIIVSTTVAPTLSSSTSSAQVPSSASSDAPVSSSTSAPSSTSGGPTTTTQVPEETNYTVPPPPQQFIDELTKHCNKIFDELAECHAIASVDFHKESCIKDGMTTGNYGMVESTRIAYMASCNVKVNLLSYDTDKDSVAKADKVRKTYGFAPVVDYSSNRGSPSSYGWDKSQCKNQCSGHGTCTYNGCTCNPGFSGADCSTDLTQLISYSPKRRQYSAPLDKDAFPANPVTYAQDGGSEPTASSNGAVTERFNVAFASLVALLVAVL